mmetsp:Transcript_4744/g.8229  ORF Transcript_4744/g.8229 Transcript_4744/m.8229 type:complete len:724 (-) Transcript_4744:1111-3282(-)
MTSIQAGTETNVDNSAGRHEASGGGCAFSRLPHELEGCLPVHHAFAAGSPFFVSPVGFPVQPDAVEEPQVSTHSPRRSCDDCPQQQHTRAEPNSLNISSVMTTSCWAQPNSGTSVVVSAAGPFCPPHGVKAVCGKRSKMEDAFSVQTHFFELPVAPMDASEAINKLPIRIALQVGEQLGHCNSPISSSAFSPNSTCAPCFSSADTDQSVGGSSVSSDTGSSCCDTLHFFGVYDGHGGIEAAQHCATRLHHHLSHALASLGTASVQNAACSSSASGVQCQAEWSLCHGQGETQPVLPSPPLPSTCSRHCHLSSAPPTIVHTAAEATACHNATGILSYGSAVDNIEQALLDAFLRTDEEFADDHSSAMVGSTAVVALVGNRRMWIANCGDSRGVLCRDSKAIQVTDDHKPEREDEAERVEKAGGQVLYWNGHRVMGVLAMSRAIGDHGLRPYVIPEPEISVLARVPEDDFLLLASDGLWDVMSNQEAIALALRCMQRAWERGGSRKAAVRVAATVLTRAAIDRGSKDNVTVVIIDLKASRPECSGNDNVGAAIVCADCPAEICAEFVPTVAASDGRAALERVDTIFLTAALEITTLLPLGVQGKGCELAKQPTLANPHQELFPQGEGCGSPAQSHRLTHNGVKVATASRFAAPRASAADNNSPQTGRDAGYGGAAAAHACGAPLISRSSAFGHEALAAATPNSAPVIAHSAFGVSHDTLAALTAQ